MLEKRSMFLYQLALVMDNTNGKIDDYEVMIGKFGLITFFRRIPPFFHEFTRIIGLQYELLQTQLDRLSEVWEETVSLHEEYIDPQDLLETIRDQQYQDFYLYLAKVGENLPEASDEDVTEILGEQGKDAYYAILQKIKETHEELLEMIEDDLEEYYECQE